MSTYMDVAISKQMCFYSIFDGYFLPIDLFEVRLFSRINSWDWSNDISSSESFSNTLQRDQKGYAIYGQYKN